jgi:hypothetical protein
MTNAINSLIAVAATLAGLVTSAVLQDARAQTIEPAAIAVAAQTVRVLKTRSVGFPQRVRIPAAPARSGLPTR